MYLETLISIYFLIYLIFIQINFDHNLKETLKNYNLKIVTILF